MITRIVKMKFQAQHIEVFQALFEKYKHSIRKQEGCSHLKLFQDQNDERIFFTYSRWENEEFLNQYRHSGLFAEVWPATKLLFEEKPEAWSLAAQVVLE